MEYILPLQRLIEQFRHLPGIGAKTAARMAFSVLELTDEEAREFADAVIGAKENIHKCKCCCNFSEEELCPVCSDADRDPSVICVVEDARDVFAFEKVREYKGLYHVLGGCLSPLNGVGPEALNMKQLLDRLADGTVAEVIVATNPTVEGEATAMYLARLITPIGVKVTRLAYGVPVGGDLEYADEVTLHRAIEGRRNII
ncbi:MAG: recombination protein RecR [Clostridia bacterium]|nr:recombination protein RecR [Clostridia bacterium]